MNRDAWDSSNKKWLSERKEVWKRYEVNLRYTKLFDRSDLKYIKDYFLFGIEPKDEDGNYYDENVTLPLIIKACCYPSCSEEDWFMLRDDVLENSFQPKTDVTRSYSMLFENGRHCDYSVENGLYDGLFLGDEQKIIGFFCGKPGEPEVINLENTDYLRYCFGEGLFLSFIEETVGWFLSEKRPNPFFVYQYLFENWKQWIEKHPQYFVHLDVESPPSFDPENFDRTKLVFIGRFNKLKLALEHLAKLKKSERIYEEPRKSFFYELCNFLDSAGITDNFEKMWEKAKRG